MINCISVIIPTKNGGQLFRESLEMIFAQEIEAQLEVVVIDSGSTDQTLKVCADYPVKLIQIPAASFNHSTTRNLAISESCGDICVLTVQDAVPIDRKWLATLVEPLLKNDKVAGAFGQQVARDDASFFTKYCLQLYYREWRSDWKQEHEQLPIELDDWNKLSFEQKRIHSRFDNTNSCLRRSVWEKTPFPVIPFAEDIAWAMAVLTSGYSIVWKPTARIIHSHERPLGYVFQRSYVDAKTIAVLFSGSSVSLTHPMLHSVMEWLSQEAARYLRSTSKQQRMKTTKIEQIGEADRVWQLKVYGAKAALGKSSIGYGTGIFQRAVSLRDFIFRQFYRGITGPMWVRQMCRNIFRSSHFLRRKQSSGSTNTLAIIMELQVSHRYFTNVLLSLHFENKCKIVDSDNSIRFAAAIMVVGFFLGKNMKSISSSEELVGVNNSNGKEVWQLLDDWYKREYEQGNTAISHFDQILANGI